MNSKKVTDSKIIILGVCGGSGSGKTTLAHALHNYWGNSLSSILSQDHYYIDQSAKFKGDGENVNFDHPDALDFSLLSKHIEDLKKGISIEIPAYDFSTHKRLSISTPFEAKKFIIVDGILILSQESIRSRFDYSIFMECPEDLRFERRLKRDVQERGRFPDGVKKQFYNQVKPMHDQFVEASKIYADLIFDETITIEDQVDKILKIIDL